MSRVVGRVALLAQACHHLAEGVSVALDGPPGIGKSALLDALESSLDALVLRASGATTEQSMSYAALQDLIDQVPAGSGGAVPDVLRAYGEAGLVGAPGTDEVRCAVSRAFRTLLEELTADGRRVVLILDDAHWLDPASACVIGYARRRLVGRVTVLATVGPGAGTGIDLAGLEMLDVPPLEAGDMIELLGRHGLPAHTAQRLHIESGGVPALALALCGAVGERPSLLGRPTPLPGRIEHVLRERFLSLPDDVRLTLRRAALLHRPTVRQLERAGRLNAEEEVRRAVELGLLARSDGVLRFTPAALGRVVAESTATGCRAELHDDLAEVAPTDARAAAAPSPGRPAPERRLRPRARGGRGRRGPGRGTRDRHGALPARRRPCALRPLGRTGRVAGHGRGDRRAGQPRRARAPRPGRPGGRAGDAGPDGPDAGGAPRAGRLRCRRHGRDAHRRARRRGRRRLPGRDGAAAARAGGAHGVPPGGRRPARRPGGPPAAAVRRGTATSRGR